MESEFDFVSIDTRFVLERRKDELTVVLDIDLWISGQRAVPYGDVVDFHVLKRSVHEEGNHFIFTCSCGIPECAGRDEGVKVEHNGDIIEWSDLDTDSKWRLRKEDLVKEVNKVNGEIKIYSGLVKKQGLKLKIE